MSNLPQKLIIDLDHPSGVAVLQMERLSAGESLDRGRGRYIALEDAPKGLIFGPHDINNAVKM